MKSWRPLLVFLAALVWLSIFQSWGGFSDPDGFYHAKMALLIAHQGPLHAFPWLDLTTLGSAFADQHLLYHFALVPFVLLWGGEWGTQIAAVFFSAAFVAAFYVLLRKLRAPMPAFWTALLLVLPHVIFRLTWAKATPLALICFFAGMACLIWRKPWMAFGVGVVYALTHGGWVLLLGCQVLYLVGTWATKTYAFDQPVSADARKDALPVLATVLGIGVGLLIHPNAHELFSFLWTQIVQVAVATPYAHVQMGNEWYPPDADALVSMLVLPFIALTVVGFGMLVSRREPLERGQATVGAALLVAAAGPFALMLKSMRVLEYALPMLVLAIASLARLVDWPLFARRMRELLPLAATSLLVTVLAVYVGYGDIQAWKAINQSAHPFGRFSLALAWLHDNAKPGERVFESQWDIFPELFYGDDRLKYVSGLDPTFLYAANPALSDGYFALGRGEATSTAYHVVHDIAGASYVFVDREESQAFLRNIQADSRFEEVFSNATASIYLVH
ncbi:MAG TPA: hypothetical protein VMU11_03845 [Verrucomicrobiae bacterium]|nr:hypothetical protein [Verrucomicrobiae bacterium]